MSSGSGEENLATALFIEIHIFLFFDPIKLFYMNVAAQRHLSDARYKSTLHLYLPDLCGMVTPVYCVILCKGGGEKGMICASFIPACGFT